MADTYNYDSDTIITGTAEADSIVNSGANVTIAALAGNDYIYSSFEANNVSISGDAGNDSIDNSGSNVTITGGAGDDSIYNSGSTVAINSGEGEDSIFNGTNSVTIDAGAGNDSIQNAGYEVSITGGAGDDSIQNDRNSVTINGGAGNDYIYNNNGYDIVFQHVAGEGDDTINGFIENSTLQVMSGTIADAYSKGNNTFLTIGKNTIVLENFTSGQLNVMDAEGNVSEYVVKKIEGTEEADNISNEKESVSIDALGGNDSITNNGNNVTISGGTGNDSISDYGMGSAYVYSAGNDTIYEFDPLNTLVLGGLSIIDSVRVTENYNDIVTLNLSNGGSIVLEDYYSSKVNTVASVEEIEPLTVINNYESNTVVTGTNSRDSISNGGDSVTINSGEGNDTIQVSGVGCQVSGGDGNDYILNGWRQGDNSTVNGGNGDDTINNQSNNNVLISGGTGNDSISNSGINAIIEGGSGDDYFNENGYGTAYVYSSGNDTLYNFNDTDAIVLGNVNILSSVGNGYNNVILNLDNGNTIFLQNYYYSKINTVASASEVVKINVIENQTRDTVITGTALKDSINNSSVENVTINAGAGNDSIHNYGDSAVINGQDGDDYIDNPSKFVIIDGGAGNDLIHNYEEKVTISGGADNDLINNSDNFVSISGAAGNDTIYNSGVNVTVTGGEGDDYFNEQGVGAAYVYSGGNDTLYNFGTADTLVLGDVSIDSSVEGDDNSVTLNMSNGNTITLRYYSSSSNTDAINTVSAVTDTEPFNIIKSSDENAIVEGTDAKDYIENSGVSSTVLGGAGDDFIRNYVANSSIAGGVGNDTIYNNYNNDNVTITGGEGNDSIFNDGNYVLIDTGADNDSILTYANNVTARGGAGDDFIQNSGGVNFTIYDEEGNDTFYENGVGTAYIYGGGSDTLQRFTIFDALILGNVSIVSSVKSDEKNNTTLNMSNGKAIVLENFNSDSIQTFATLDEYERYNIVEVDYDQYSIAGTSGKDYISTWKNNATINAGAGNDYIYNGGESTLVEGETGDDYIYNYSENASIAGGAGNDSIENSGNSVYVAGGAGNDSIENIGNNVSVLGGAGNDSIKNTGGINLTIYDDTGNDYFNENGYGTAYVYGGGNDTLAKFTELDALILGDVSIVSSVKGDDNSVTLNMSNGNSIVLTDYDSDSINALATLDEYERFNIIENYNEFTSVEGTDGKDYIGNRNYNATITGNAGDDYIFNSYSDVSINGGAGNDTIRSYDANVTVDGGAGNDVIIISSYYENNFVEYSAGNDSVYGFGNNATLIIAGGSYASMRRVEDIIFTVGNGSIVLKNSASLSAINVSDGTQTTVIENEPFFENMTITDNTNSPVTFQTDAKTADASARKKAIQITGNELDNTITGGSGNDTLDGAEGNDILTGGKGKDLFVFSGGNDSITDYDKNDKLSIGGGLVYEDYTLDGEDLILNFGADNVLSITGGADKTISYLVDKKTTTTEYTADEVILGDKKKSATLTSAVEKFDATSSKDYSKLVTIDGSATGAIEIIGNKKKNYIIAGNQGASITGGKGNDTLLGGAGADLFIYENKTGKDVIENFGEGDSINLDSNVTIKDAKTKGGDSVLKFKGGALTVKDTTEFNIGETVYRGGVFIAGDSAKVYGSFKDAINLADYGVNNFDGSAGKKKLSITGTNSADSLVGGKGKDSLLGGAGNDTLWGGKGNDTLWGGDGNDTFIYQAGQGKDVIADYAAGDLLTILDKKGDAGDFKKATFKNDTLTLGIQGGGKVLVSGVAGDTSININGNSRTVSDLIK